MQFSKMSLSGYFLKTIVFIHVVTRTSQDVLFERMKGSFFAFVLEQLQI